MKREYKVAYFEGRPHGHPTHSLYAKSVGATFFHFDKYLRYHDISTNKFRTVISWLLTTFLFPKRKYDIILTEEPYLSVALMKTFRLLKNKKKIVSQLGTHTLYFIKANKYTPFTKKLLLYTFSKYDAIICEGKMQKELLEEFLKGYKNQPKINAIFNGAKEHRVKQLHSIKPKLLSKKIVSIAEATNSDRVYYKGIDLNIRTFANIYKNNSQYTYDIIGNIPQELQKDLLKNIDKRIASKINFLGRIDDFENKISEYALCLHLSRGEAWGVSINECLLAGIPTIVSEWTGSKEILKKIDSNLIVPLDIDKAADAVTSYFNSSEEEKLALSKKCKNISQTYTEKKAVDLFRTHFYESIK